MIRIRRVFIRSVFALLAPATFAAGQLYQVGVGRVDVTPDFPIRLTGYTLRSAEATSAAQRLWAKALVIAVKRDAPFVLVTVDNCAIPASVRDEVLRRVASRGITSERFALSFSHTHTGPCLAGSLANIFAQDIPPEHQARIDRYTHELIDKLAQAAFAALDAMAPARLEWGIGQVRFARNRRKESGGIIDHDLPVLAVRAGDGALRAVFASYGCHATTLEAAFNQFHGDWVGHAREMIEREHPGVTALIAIGCGAEANPHPRGLPPFAEQHGRELATEVARLLESGLRPIAGDPVARAKTIELPFDRPPTRAEWEKRAQSQDRGTSYHARKHLARLDRGERLRTHLPYLVQTWTFGRDLAMTFLPGEVVADYSLRLKEEFDSERIWINAYSNDAPAYIPSKRVLELGAYEGARSMEYYDQPTRFAPVVEDLILGAVRELIPAEFLAAQRANPLPRPTTPEEAVSLIKARPGFTVELVAAEPLIVDPVAIDFGPDGRLWVVEMRDYPMGMDGNWKPGGRIKVLTSTKHDGVYDRATVFMDDLPFPSGVMPWRKGVLVCAAPDILYGEDTDGDGRADVVRKILTGFETENYQSRVNSLSLGLDGWVYAANGARGGVVRGMGADAPAVDIRGHDIRFQPDTGKFELVAGLTSHGRARDDWDNWFGCSSVQLAYHFPMPERYARRNPHVAGLPANVYVLHGAEHNRVHPLATPLERFNWPAHLNHATAACGLSLYRDELLGAGFTGNAFVCEPAHAVVTRRELQPAGATFTGRRPAGEETSEFLASRSIWFTPVQTRSGPDGALWVVDMVRPVIEHPRWIPPERLAKLNTRAGDDKGRIYRVFPERARPRPMRNLTTLDLPQLVKALDTPNGTTRDLVHLELLFRRDARAVPLLEELLHSGIRAAPRVQVLAALDAFDALTPLHVRQVLRDADPRLRRFALHLGERFLVRPTDLDAMLPALAADPDAGVRYQLALTLGEWYDAGEAARLLGRLALHDLEDRWVRAAVISSATRDPVGVLNALPALTRDSPVVRGELAAALTATAVAVSADLDALLVAVAPRDPAAAGVAHLIALAGLQDALERRSLDLARYPVVDKPELGVALARIREVYAGAAGTVRDKSAGIPARQAALRLLTRGFNDFETNLPLLASLLGENTDPALLPTVVDVMRRSASPRVPDVLLRHWNRFSPSLRSTVAQTLLSRSEWAGRLLDAVEAGRVPLAGIPASQRQALLVHGDETIRRRAEKLAAGLSSRDRQEVIARYRAVKGMAGDTLRGAKIFGDTCAGCHQFIGESVGPDLTFFRNKSTEDFLMAILDPNAAVEPRYAGYIVTTRDGRSLAGVIGAESGASFRLLQPGNMAQDVLRADVASLSALDRSFMPESLEGSLTVQDMADLIAYIRAWERTVGGVQHDGPVF